ncbi:MAG: PqqD family protein [Gammaproteobacteria bacterium]|nr:PqqD family protein [Gammaproteobacteria bacterium]
MNQQFIISSEAISQEIGGETVILDLNGEAYFGLNQVGTKIWQLLHDTSNRIEILNGLEQVYDIERSELERDLDELLEQLLDSGLIHIKDSPGK